MNLCNECKKENATFRHGLCRDCWEYEQVAQEEWNQEMHEHEQREWRRRQMSED